MGLMDDVTVPAQCPKCGHTEEKPVTWLAKHQPFPCPVCKEPVAVDNIDEMAASFEKLNELGASSDVTIGGKRK